MSAEKRKLAKASFLFYCLSVCFWIQLTAWISRSMMLPEGWSKVSVT